VVCCCGLLPVPFSNHLPESRESSVGIATRYGLDGPGIESQWRRDFLYPSSPDLGPTQHPIQLVKLKVKVTLEHTTKSQKGTEVYIYILFL
jgi:hypothetical protein